MRPRILSVLLIYIICSCFQYGHTQILNDTEIPFSTGQNQLTVWNGREYVPFFLKGMNLGISVPGTFPGQLAATRAQYGRWFKQIKEAGFNSIRIYTLHYPRFYQVLDSFNMANPQNPLFFFQGVWLNEEMEGYANDLYYMTETFKAEIAENIDCVHGNKTIELRFGKAFGDYRVDVSMWNIGYIIGREIHPVEVNKTDEVNSENNSYHGSHLSIQNATPTEAWLTEKLDYLVNYENSNYFTQRPVSVSSWPTLDPIVHNEEPNRTEDSEQIDLSKVELVNAPAGFFISYHAYPYYPDFISEQSSYQPYEDDYGRNSYKGYLTDLKSHYKNIPLIIAEYGVPSSWGIAHYSSSGMNHGGYDEKAQGETNIRMLHTIQDVECGGGFQFAWIDEWFKRNWITDPIDYNPDRRILWNNIMAAEQNFGLIRYSRNTELENIQSFEASEHITHIKAAANYSFFEIEIGLNNPLDILDNLWLALDTYRADLGESIIPTGDTLPYRSEFAINIKTHSSSLYVTQAYDVFGIWHGVSEPEQKYRSTVSDGAPWNIVRWKNNSGHSDIQYVGNLKQNYGFQPPSSKDAITIYDDKIHIRLPWSLINVVDPSQMIVFDDDRTTPQKEEVLSDGFAISIKYKDQIYKTESRYSWEKWNYIKKDNLIEEPKVSYYVMKDRLHEFDNNAIAVCDSFIFEDVDFPAVVSEDEGLLINDFDFDGDYMITMLVHSPVNGQVDLYNDGSFSYLPNNGYNGRDSFEYSIYDGYRLSAPNKVILSVDGNSDSGNELQKFKRLINIFPNPASDFLTVRSELNITKLMLFNASGILIKYIPVDSDSIKISVSSLPPGNYFISASIKDRTITERFVVTQK